MAVSNISRATCPAVLLSLRALLSSTSLVAADIRKSSRATIDLSPSGGRPLPSFLGFLLMLELYDIFIILSRLLLDKPLNMSYNYSR